MGRKSTFYDQQFRDDDWNPDDPGEYEHGLVFLAMSFVGQEMDDIYSAIKSECVKIGLRPVRVDENTGSGFVIKEIKDLIEKAEFIIVDLTNEKPNIYYELGYAHGVGNEAQDILLLAKENTTLHFDIAPLRVQFYTSTDHLRKIVNTNLKEMMRVTRK
ncbi:MAG TPA: hypothetical protein ENL07_04690 [Chlorobaculum parvum]|uniref:CD-NTase-associated protein 12/Pycsar effector protein TIR domain-containing protein n=1 Tax=Chlorobaculum parvum TaxID=274539 RepID=A0A7C5HJ57_9CHLB|nr:hypothetical protein [Chlorobaculum parvum]